MITDRKIRVGCLFGILHLHVSPKVIQLDKRRKMVVVSYKRGLTSVFGQVQITCIAAAVTGRQWCHGNHDFAE